MLEADISVLLLNLTLAHGDDGAENRHFDVRFATVPTTGWQKC